MGKSGWVFCISILLLLGGCGGGDSEESAGVQAPAPPPSVPEPPPPPPENPPPEDPPPENPPPENPPPEEPPPPPLGRVGKPLRAWEFHAEHPGTEAVVLDIGGQIGGELLKTISFGPVVVSPPELAFDGSANGEVYANESGETYWVEAEAPLGRVEVPTDVVGSRSIFEQHQTYIKRAANATLQLKITEVRLDTIDLANADTINEFCIAGDPEHEICFKNVMAGVGMDVSVYEDPLGRLEKDDRYRGHYSGYAQVSGRNSFWDWEHGWSELPFQDPTPIFEDRDFELQVVDEFGSFGSRASLRLTRTVVVDVDLSEIDVGMEFDLRVEARAVAINLRPGEGESYASARLRDPVHIGGVVMNVTGLESIDAIPSENPVDELPPVTPHCSASALPEDAGTLQFTASRYATAEFGSPNGVVRISRVGGNQGEVSALLTTSDDTAIAGVHYKAINRTIVFRDGVDAPVSIDVPVINDTVHGGNKTLNLTLTARPECATLGSVPQTTLTIVDDEELDDTRRVSGVVSGLAGSGAVFEDFVTGAPIPAANGAFAIDYAYPPGSPYDVRVRVQPSNPNQICSVNNGRGTIDNADVNNISIVCATQTLNGELDPTFGGGDGMVSLSVSSADATAVALQSDGKIIVGGDTSLVRFNADGSLDTSFGNNGVAGVPFNGTSAEVTDVAVQSDDKILVAGLSRVGNRNHMAVARMTAAGAVDTSFGTSGLTTVHPYAGTGADANDRGHKLFVQPDGTIFLAGAAGIVSGSVRSNYAVVKLDANGVPVTQFGGDGAATMSFPGTVNLAYGVGVQSDGKVVLAGRTGDNFELNIGLIRFHTDGVLDEDYGRPESGIPPGVVISDLTLGFNDEASDMIMLEDDSILVSAVAMFEPLPSEDPAYCFTVAHYSSDGLIGGSGNYVCTSIGPSHDVSRALARQADGKIVVVGQTYGSTANDFGVVRYNPDLSLDTAFGTNGAVRVDFFGADDGATDVVVQPDGKILVVGFARNGTSGQIALLRIAP